MRNYVMITKGDLIAFKYNNKQYEIAITEVKPADAVLVVETDLQVDFEPPVGYVEPDYSTKKSSLASSLETRSTPQSTTFKPFSGTSQRLTSVRPSTSTGNSGTTTQPDVAVKEVAVPKNTLVFTRPPAKPEKPPGNNSFSAFSGKSNKLQ